MLETFPILATRDLDEARSAVSATYLENYLTQLGQESLRFVLNASEAYDFTVGYLAYSTEVSLQMPPSGDFYHVNLTTGGHTDAWREDRQTCQTSRGECGVVLPPHRLSRVRWSCDAEQVIFRFSRRRLEDHLARLIGREVADPIDFDLNLDLRTGVGAGLFTMALSMVDEFDRMEAVPGHTFVVRQMEELLMTRLLCASHHNYTDELEKAGSGSLARPVVADRRLRKVRDYIEKHLAQDTSLDHLAVIGGVSVRTLHAIFKDELGMTPRQHIRDRRLEAVREDLTAASASDTVGVIAARWGITHMSRFSSAYRTRFGENPSATLRRTVDGLPRK